MRYVSIFSGIEAASVAWQPLGWHPLAFAEIEPFPCAVLAERFPDVPNLGDVSEIDWSQYRGRTDVIVGGSPCFVAGTPITTARGVIPIEDVASGDLVLTHKGRWRKVTAIGSSVSDTIVLRGQGTAAVECTPSHPFWARNKRSRSTRVNGKPVRIVDIGDPEWVRAEGLDHLFWFCPGEIEPLPVPKFESSDFTYQPSGEGHLHGFEFTEAFFRFVGIWLGDGWANTHRRKGRRDSVMKRVYVCCAKGEESDMEAMLGETGLHWGMSESRTTYRFTCSSNQLYDWMVGNFGVHADGKTLPGWVFGMRREWRRALLGGYLSTDGCRVGRNMRSMSVSRCLTVGMKTLAATLGITSSVVRTEPRSKVEIEGREVNERPYYTQTYYGKSRSAFFKDGGWWGLVRNVLPGSHDVTVYNLEVEEDSSYAADGIAVHNCQSFSVAGNRGGLDDPRGRLMLEYVRAVRDIRPRWVVWENVPGVLSQDGGRAFATLLRELSECGLSLAWRVLDAQFFGVAQRRRRVFVVGGPTVGRAAAVLFEPGCVPGGSGASRAKREALTRTAGKCVAGEGGCLTPGDNQSQRIYGIDGAAPTLSSRSAGVGDNTPAIAFKHYMGAKAGGIGYGEDVCPTLTDSSAHQPAVAFAQNERDEVRLINGDGQIAGALSAQTGARQQTYVCMTDTQPHALIDGDVCGALSATMHKDPPVAAYAMREREGKPGGGKGPLLSEDVSLTLLDHCDQTVFHEDSDGWIVRRLTPVECERLQGFPDGWTDIPGARDGQRYKAIGNSMAVPVMRWIGERIDEVDQLVNS